MKKITPSQIVTFVCQITIIIILGFATWSKFYGEDIGFFIFESLGIPETRLFIATLEGIAVIFLLIPSFVHYGALLSFGVMMGALMAHISVLGWSVYNDGGELSMLMITVIVASVIILWIHRRKMPLIGHVLD